MNPIILIGIATALAMDTFAVSIAIAIALKIPSTRQILRPACYFGMFQFGMSVVGWLAGRGFVQYIQGFDHWVAFGLLSFIGCKMIYKSTVIGCDEEMREHDPTTGMSLIILSVATSIDSLAVGLSLSLINVRILCPAVVIGVVTFAWTALGMKIGPLAGRLLGKRAEVAGGLILLAIGFKILLEHFL